MKNFKLIFLLFTLVNCQLLDKPQLVKVFPKKKPAQKSSLKEKQEWLKVKIQKTSSFEERIKLLDQFIQSNKNKQMALSAYLLKARILLKNKKNQRACFTYHKIVSSSFEYKGAWSAYLKSAQCYLKEKKTLQAFEVLENFIQNSKGKEKKQASSLQWSFLKNKEGWIKYKLISLSHLVSFSKKESEKSLWLKKGRKLIDQIPEENLKDYTAYSSYFPAFESYLFYKTGRYYFRNKQFKESEGYFKRALFASSSPEIKKEISQTLFVIKKMSKTNPHLIGVILPLSGRKKLLGEKILRGLSMGFDLSKSSPFQMIVLDNKNHFDVTKAHIDELFYKHHVMALIGGLNRKTAGIIAKKAEQFAIPAILFSQSHGLTKDKKFIFQNAVTARQLLEPLIEKLTKELKIKNMSALFPDDSYGTEYVNDFEELFEKSGGKIVDRVSYKLGEVDFKEEVKELLHLNLKDREEEYERLKEEMLKENKSLTARSYKLTPENVLPIQKDFSGLFIPDTLESLNKIRDHLRYFGLKDIPLVGLNLWRIDKIKSRDFSFVFVNLDDTNKKKSGFYENFFRQYGQAPGHFEQKAYNTAAFLKKALNSRSVKSRLSLQKELESIKSFKGAYKDISISKDHVFQYPVKVYISEPPKKTP